jgi:hypothetical protein
VREAECGALLRDFFRELRSRGRAGRGDFPATDVNA